MKNNLLFLKTFLFFIFFTSLTHCSLAQGRVVINEYMPWTLNGCGATAEFVELLNFGPGPVNIGGYILTDGDFAVTIPANTLLQPGEFYVLSGQTTLPAPCGNIDSTITAQLNWTTCGCTSGPIPSTGDGFFTDGGSANEPVVLLDRNLKVIDAVVRSLPTESSSTITTKDMGYGSQTFNLDNMNIDYETLGMSTGRGNSFARRIDGDCGWVKDPQQSAHATNNRSGNTGSATYTLNIINSMDCGGSGGSIAITVNASNYTSLFPMNYILAYDLNKDGAFDSNDQYTEGIENTPKTIRISGLRAGRYRVTVASVKGCNLQSFDFTILPCMVVLPVKLTSFNLVKKTDHNLIFEYRIIGADNLSAVVLEKSMDQNTFSEAAMKPVQRRDNDLIIAQLETPGQINYTFYRLHIIGKDGSVYFSPVISINSAVGFALNRLWPNPAKDKLNVEVTMMDETSSLNYTLYNNYGTAVSKGTIKALTGTKAFTIPVHSLPTGYYQVVFSTKNTAVQPIYLPFVKQ
ncbi:MAG: lamin tail domain-containing protein [Flavisolibacter sp.]|nr:lamin tail domain-containing protein [Flavisolibacter sp.]